MDVIVAGQTIDKNIITNMNGNKHPDTYNYS